MRYLIFIYMYPLFIAQCFAQQFSEKNMFVWDFYNEEGETDHLAEKLSDCTEEILVELGYTVLIRREYSDISRLVKMEKAIGGITDISSSTQEKILSKSADIVVIGKDINTDYSGNTFMRITFDDLRYKQRVLVNTITFSDGAALNVIKRKQILKKELMKMLGYKIEDNNTGNILEEQLWTETIRNPSKEQIEEYISAFPAGKYINDARKLISDLNKCKNLTLTILPGNGILPNGRKLSEYEISISDVKLNYEKPSVKVNDNERFREIPWYQRSRSSLSRYDNEFPLNIELEDCTFQYYIEFTCNKKIDYSAPRDWSGIRETLYYQGIVKGSFTLNTSETYFLNILSTTGRFDELIGILEKNTRN